MELSLESRRVEMCLANVGSHHKQEARCTCVSSALEEGKESTAVRPVQNSGRGQPRVMSAPAAHLLLHSPQPSAFPRLRPAPSLSVKWATDTIWTKKQINITRHVTVTHPLWEWMPAS